MYVYIYIYIYGVYHNFTKYTFFKQHSISNTSWVSPLRQHIDLNSKVCLFFRNYSW